MQQEAGNEPNNGFLNQNLSDRTHTFAIVLLFVCFTLVGTALTVIYGKALGFDVFALADMLAGETTEGERNFFRTTALINQLCTFLLPCLFFGWIFYKSRWTNFYRLNRPLLAKPLIFSFLLLLLSFPIVQLSYWLNQQLPLPDWAMMMEENTGAMIQNILGAVNPYEVLFNLLVIAVLPAVGEELLFRGFIQQKLVKNIANPHLAIWLGAIIFSAFHLQFEGFLPRAILGAVLGYTFYWSGNLWIPILLHFFNNGFQVILPYFMPEEVAGMEDLEVGWGSWLMGAAALFLIGVMIQRRKEWFGREDGRRENGGGSFP